MRAFNATQWASRLGVFKGVRSVMPVALAGLALIAADYAHAQKRIVLQPSLKKTPAGSSESVPGQGESHRAGGSHTLAELGREARLGRAVVVSPVNAEKALRAALAGVNGGMTEIVVRATDWDADVSKVSRRESGRKARTSRQ